MSTFPEKIKYRSGFRLISALLTPKRRMDTKILTYPTSCPIQNSIFLPCLMWSSFLDVWLGSEYTSGFGDIPCIFI